MAHVCHGNLKPPVKYVRLPISSAEISVWV